MGLYFDRNLSGILKIVFGYTESVVHSHVCECECMWGCAHKNLTNDFYFLCKFKFRKKLSKFGQKNIHHDKLYKKELFWFYLSPKPYWNHFLLLLLDIKDP